MFHIFSVSLLFYWERQVQGYLTFIFVFVSFVVVVVLVFFFWLFWISFCSFLLFLFVVVRWLFLFCFVVVGFLFACCFVLFSHGFCVLLNDFVFVFQAEG